MGITYTSFCKTCNLCVDAGKDYSGIRHALFKLYHTYRFNNHEVERWNEDDWYEFWNRQNKNMPEQLYDISAGYLVQIPDWLSALEDSEIEKSLKGVTAETQEEVIARLIQENQDKLIESGLSDYEYRLKRSCTVHIQRRESDTNVIELMPHQRLIIYTGHGSFIVDDRVRNINVFAVRNGVRNWITTFEDGRILKFGSEDKPIDTPHDP